MGQKKRKKAIYDIIQTLRPIAFPSQYEELTHSLYKKACQGACHLFNDTYKVRDLANNAELRGQFYRAANLGMMSAQNDIIDIVKSDAKLETEKEFLLRGIADAIAWQILGGQLAYARRFFKSKPQPDLYNSNLDSVVRSAKTSILGKTNAVALISDLTSFIQVGDLLVYEPEKGFEIVEVKTGHMNERIANFMNFHSESQCDIALRQFANVEGAQALKQMERMRRQIDRMSHVSSTINTGRGVDPDTKETVIIPEEYFPIESWDYLLNSALKRADATGWAIDVIDNSVFIGVYTGKHMLHSGHVLFNGWFDKSGATKECPRTRLIDCMWTPLALPIFNRNISDKHKFDVLFGRSQVCMGICIESLLSECKEAGLAVRAATNKERGTLEQKGVRYYKYKGNAIVISNGNNEITLMDGLFLRVMFHGQRPISLIKTILGEVRRDNTESPKSNT